MKLNCALLGTGRQAKRLVNAIQNNEAVVASLYSREEKTGRDFLEYTMFPKALIYNDIEKAVNNTNVNSVVIATPDFLHYAHSKSALEAKKHVYVEKPLASSVQEGQELIELSRALDLCLYVGYHLRQVTALQFINKLFQEGYYGKIYNFNLYWGLELGNLNAQDDRSYAQIIGSKLVTHLIDLALWNLKPTCGKVTDSSAICFNQFTKGSDDSVHMCMEFENGARCSLICTSGSVIPLRMEIVSEKGIFFYDKILGRDQEINFEGKIKKFSYIDPWTTSFSTFASLIKNREHFNPALEDNLENIQLLLRVQSEDGV